MTRPRGFIEAWNPRANTEEVLQQVEAILEQYQEYLPMTARQIFYRLVGAYDYPKTERDYKRLCENLQKARRSRRISMDAIRDDGLNPINQSGWDTPASFLGAIKTMARDFRLDRQEGQDSRLVVICEAAGMAPQLATVAKPYCIDVIGSGGFDSLTSKYTLARQAASCGRLTVLHVGDHDPSGVHIAKNLQEDVGAFATRLGGEFEVVRVAVLPEHIERYSLVTAPPKKTDNRSFEGETVQAEALDPSEIATLLDDAIQTRFDFDAYSNILLREEDARGALNEALAGVEL